MVSPLCPCSPFSVYPLFLATTSTLVTLLLLLDPGHAQPPRPRRSLLAHDLSDLAKVNNYSAVLEYIEQLQRTKNCGDGKTGVVDPNSPISPTNSPYFDIHTHLQEQSYANFVHVQEAAIRAANTLNNLFRAWDTAPETLYNDVFYYSMARALVETPVLEDRVGVGVGSGVGKDDAGGGTGMDSGSSYGQRRGLYGATVAFDRAQYRDDRTLFAPYVYRARGGSGGTSTSSGSVAPSADGTAGSGASSDQGADHERGNYIAKNLATISKGKYAETGTRGYEWFWRQRKNYPELLQHEAVCTSVTPDTAADAQKYTNVTTALTTAALGIWTAPYYDCDGGHTWMVTYSVPFFGCMQNQRRLLFK
jgi:hypothetical protein